MLDLQKYMARVLLVAVILLHAPLVSAQSLQCAPVDPNNTCPADKQCCNGYCIDTKCVCLLEPLPGGQHALCPDTADTTGGAFQGTLFFRYLNAGGMFQWGLGIGVALAILNVTIGGFQIMTGGADPAQVEAGKTRIFGSILGLIFLMFAGVILTFINPIGFRL